MFEYLYNWWQERIIQGSDITAAEWEAAYASLPVLMGLTIEEKTLLQRLVILFLHQKVLEGAHQLDVTRLMAIQIGLQACLPILHLGLECYNGWTSVIIYPSDFAPKRRVIDENGIEHFMQSTLSGESWQRGPVVLAWDKTATAGIIDGHNVVIHEFIHKLDMQNGAANGFPPLHSDMQVEKWTAEFQKAFADLQHECESGRFVKFNCYAANSPAEFFAVISEEFFERPMLLDQHYPEVYDLLKQYFRQDTITRF